MRVNNIYSVSFAAVAVSAAQDVFEIVAPATGPIRIREVRLGQYSDFGDAAAEVVSVQIIRGFTVTGSGGTAATPADFSTSAVTSASTVAVNNTTVANTGTTVTLLATSWNIVNEFVYRPPKDERIVVVPSGRLVVRIPAPADAVTMNGTMIFEELTNV